MIEDQLNNLNESLMRHLGARPHEERDETFVKGRQQEEQRARVDEVLDRY